MYRGIEFRCSCDHTTPHTTVTHHLHTSACTAEGQQRKAGGGKERNETRAPSLSDDPLNATYEFRACSTVAFYFWSVVLSVLVDVGGRCIAVLGGTRVMLVAERARKGGQKSTFKSDCLFRIAAAGCSRDTNNRESGEHKRANVPSQGLRYNRTFCFAHR